MKKKKMFCMLLACLFTLSAFSAIVKTTCGKTVYTVNQSYFDTFGEWLDFMYDLNASYCGKEGGTMYYMDTK